MYCLLVSYGEPDASNEVRYASASRGLSNRFQPVKTSSTAQGGGGGFKGRKSIGEVSGCCDAWMAERTYCWTEKWLELCFLEWLLWSPDAHLLDVG